MKARFAPISSFLYRADAESAAQLLKGDGVDSMVRDANDCPEGYRALQRQVGFTLWVNQSDRDKALEALRKAAPPPLLCGVCGTGRASEHVTLIRNGERET